MKTATISSQNTDGSKVMITWESSIASVIHQNLQQRKSRTTNINNDKMLLSPSNNNNNAPLMIALVGIPGSGKSTSASILSTILKEKYQKLTMIMPHDGYHYSIQQLKDIFPPSSNAIYRRGAPDTFDSQKLKRDLQRIQNKDETIISLPGFDHARGDPEPNCHIFDRNEHEVVICEGLYLLHDDDGWDLFNSKLFDLSIFIDSSVDDCIERLKIRNQCIPGYTKAEIFKRCDDVDRKNANIVFKSKSKANIIVQSIIN